jgi:hypothetical protein
MPFRGERLISSLPYLYPNSCGTLRGHFSALPHTHGVHGAATPDTIYHDTRCSHHSDQNLPKRYKTAGTRTGSVSRPPSATSCGLESTPLPYTVSTPLPNTVSIPTPYTVSNPLPYTVSISLPTP